MDKREISKILNEIGLLLELKGENIFKVRAYYNGAKIVAQLDEDIVGLVKEKRLGEIKGIGKALDEKITELVTTGKLGYYDDLKKDVPEGIFDLLKIPGIGPNKLRQLYKSLDITSVGELEYACMENRLVHLKGFGKKTQDKILDGIKNLKKYEGKFLLSEALHVGNYILREIEKNPNTIRASLAGELRRRKEIISNIDIVVSTKEENRQKILDDFLEIKVIEGSSDINSYQTNTLFDSGISVNLHTVTEEEYPYALHYHTGSGEYNKAIQLEIERLGAKIIDYSLFDKDGAHIYFDDEEDFFNYIGLQYIPPELRENDGEIQAAKVNRIPRLIEIGDMQGTLHNHSIYSDGFDTIKTMAMTAKKMGHKYIGISDHSQSAYYAGGLKEDNIIEQHSEIRRLNQESNGIYIFKGIESDILAQGSLDYEDSILDKFDYVIASIHTNFNMNKEEATDRIIKGVENKYTKILGHPTGRLLLAREGYPLDIERVLTACKTNNVAIEVNANPHRLDADWRMCKLAKKVGVKIAIEPDSHRAEGLQYISYGIDICRKGWLEPTDIINTFTLQQMKKFLGVQ